MMTVIARKGKYAFVQYECGMYAVDYLSKKLSMTIKAGDDREEIEVSFNRLPTPLKKITKATFRNFINKNRERLYIKVTSRFNGYVDMIESQDEEFEKAIFNATSMMGVAGLYLVGQSRDYFAAYDDGIYTGIQYNNCVGSGVIAVRKSA